MTIVQDINGNVKLVSLGGLSWEDSESFQKEFNRQLLRWRHRRKHLDRHLLDAIEDACEKVSPNYQVIRSHDGYRVIPQRVRSSSIMSGQLFRELSIGRGDWHDTSLVKEMYWEGEGTYTVEVLYDGGNWRKAKPHKLFSWGLRAVTEEGYRNFSWEKLELIRLLEPEELEPARRLLLFLDERNRLQSERFNWS